MWNKIKNWWLTLIKEEYELTIYFPGKTELLENGTRILSADPKTYRAKAIKKLTPKHIIFIDLEGRKHEVKTVNAVGYDITKIY
jgi:hypothetical protein|tara:strand:+ start:1048 stop:1299 length:252 start_codon:yes stop_codon:yes gene_type:complete